MSVPSTERGQSGGAAGSAATVDRIPLGIALMLLTTLLFAAMNVQSKQLANLYPVVLILWARYLMFSLFGLSLGVHRHGPREAFRSVVPFLQVGRALLLIGEVGVYLLAFKVLPLAEISSISAMGPLVVTGLSALLLGEKVGLRRWAAVLVGFLGVLVIIRPGFAGFDPRLLIPVGGMLLYALYQVLTRLAARYDSSERSTLFTGVVGLGVLTALVPFHWTPVDAEGAFHLFLLACFGVGGHGLLIKALSLAPASVLQPFSYVGLVWAVLFGYLFFGDLPATGTVIGASVIVASGLYTLHRERVRKSDES